ncbi:MAG: glycerophosphoryl diester phosphodiesterase [Actinomycetota bacterium]|jgi:glycerophosphoryl diester phosphodiesterase
MTRIFGHRGASSVFRENTLDAFRGAAELGADGVELDVRRTADGALAVHHDATFADGRNIVDTPAIALPSDVPQLRDALVACGAMAVNVEIKNVPIDPDFDADEAVAAAVVALIDDMGIAEQIIVSSFSLNTIDAVRAANPELATGWLTVPSYDQLRALGTAVEHGHTALNPHHSVVSAELAAAVRDASLALNTWTVDEPEEMRRLAGLGVDTIITNDVALAVKTLRG